MNDCDTHNHTHTYNSDRLEIKMLKKKKLLHTKQNLETYSSPVFERIFYL